jgi:hypothetical protein
MPDLEQPFDPDAAARATAYLDVVERVLPADPDAAVVWDDCKIVKLTRADLRQVLAQRAYAKNEAAQLADSCADWRGRYEEQRTRAERLHTTIARITALEVHGHEFVDAAELYRILDKPIPPPIDHAANIRARADQGH